MILVNRTKTVSPWTFARRAGKSHVIFPSCVLRWLSRSSGPVVYHSSWDKFPYFICPPCGWLKRMDGEPVLRWDRLFESGSNTGCKVGRPTAGRPSRHGGLLFLEAMSEPTPHASEQTGLQSVQTALDKQGQPVTITMLTAFAHPRFAFKAFESELHFWVNSFAASTRMHFCFRRWEGQNSCCAHL